MHADRKVEVLNIIRKSTESCAEMNKPNLTEPELTTAPTYYTSRFTFWKPSPPS